MARIRESFYYKSGGLLSNVTAGSVQLRSVVKTMTTMRMMTSRFRPRARSRRPPTGNRLLPGKGGALMYNVDLIVLTGCSGSQKRKRRS